MKNPSDSLYFAIYNDIKEQIISGRLSPGEALPSEARLEKLYNTSRAPVRQALAMLENEFFLDRCQGRGTFVIDRKKRSSWLLSSGFAKDIERDLDFVSSKTLYVQREKPNNEVADLLGLDASQNVIHIHRMRYYKNEPIFSMHNYLRNSLNIDIFRQAGDFFLISEILERDFQIALYKAEEEVRAIIADSKLAEELHVSLGTPLLDMKRIYYTNRDMPVFLSRYQARTDHWTYRMEFTSDSPS